ncbi:hypothetical protein [Fictibacillus gelatini]|nr:hypothetical protein [Fictibacillus gelatini]
MADLNEKITFKSGSILSVLGDLLSKSEIILSKLQALLSRQVFIV